jgi:acetyl-CoA acetyltransferase
MSRPRSYQSIALTSPVSLGYSKTSEHSARWYLGSVLRELIGSAGISKQQIDGLAVSSFGLAPDSVSFLTQHFDMSLRWLEQLPFGGASGVIAMRRAARAVQSGDAEIVACIGGDTSAERSFRDLVADFSSFSNSASYPYGSGGPNVPFAMITRAYMDRFGATREDFGKIATSQRYNAQHFPGAVFHDKPLTLEDYLSARPVSSPLHLFDCVMPCAGGEGFLLMTIERAKSLGVPYVLVLAAGERHNAFPDDPIQLRGGWPEFAGELYTTAGINSQDIDLLQTYDDYPVICMLQMEGLGFCAEGKAPDFVRQTDLRFDGDGLPHNTSGGQLSGGQAGSAAGYLGVVESIRQLTDAAHTNQVADARYAMVSGYGMINYDRGVCSTAAILARGEE